MSQIERLQHKITKLSFQKGDILVCHDLDTMNNLAELRIEGIDFIVPVVFAPKGVEKLTRAQLMEIVRALPPQPQ